MHSEWTWRPRASTTSGGFFDQASIDDDLAAIDHDLQQPGFWDDPQKSAPLLQKRRTLERQKEAVQRLRSDSDELESVLGRWAEHPDEAIELGRRAHALCEAQRGASEKTAKALAEILK